MLTFVTLVNDHGVFARCRGSALGHGGDEYPWVVVEPNRHGWNASRGLNHGLDQARTPWVVFVHQDVLFPLGWTDRIARCLEALPQSVAVAGVSGTRADGRFRGHLLDPNGHCFWGPLPAEVLTLDEVVLIVRRSTGLRFDDDVPGFHCYGADLCLRARAEGHQAWALDAPLQHLSTGVLDSAYTRSAAWILEKWGEDLGYIVPTPPAIIQDPKRAGALRRFMFRLRRSWDHRRRNSVPNGVAIEFRPAPEVG